MTHKKKISLIAAGVFAALILLSMTILPAVVKTWITDEARQTTGRKTTLQSLAFNPLTMTITARGIAMEEQGGGSFFSIGSIRASLSPKSIYKRALILSEVAIESPSFSITRTAPNLYNFTDIQQRIQAQKKPESDQELRFSINNITIAGGSVDFHDLAVNGGRKHSVRNLEVGIPFISNIPYLVESYTSPKISAVVNGAPFHFAGKMKPLSKSMETSVRINLNQLDLPELVAYSPQKPPARLTSGKLTVDMDLNYRVFSDRKPELIIKGLLRLDGIAIDLNNGHPLVKLPLLEVKASKLEIFSRLFQFQNIRLDGLELFASRDGRGQWMYANLMPKEKAYSGSEDTSTRPPPAKNTLQPSLQISSLSLTNSSVHFNDSLPRGGFRGSLSEITLSLNNLSNAPNTSAEYDLSLLLDNEADLTSAGNFSLAPLSLKASTDLSGLKLQKGWPYLSSYLTAPLKGVLDLSGDVTYSTENGLTAEQGSLTLKDLSTRYGSKDGLDLSLFSVSNASYRQKENHLELAEVKVSKGTLSVSREADGRISLLSLINTGAAPATHTAPPAVQAKQKKRNSTSAPQPFSYRLSHLQTDHLNLAFTDKTREEKPRFTLRNSTTSLSNLSGPKFTPAQLRFNATFGKNTPLKASGDITPLPFHYKGNVSVGRLAIRDFEDYFPDNLNVSVLSGYLDTSLKLDISLKNGKPEGSFKGSAGVRSFHSIDTDAEEDLLKWESLQVDEFQGRVEPFSLAIRQIALNGFFSRIAILKNGSLNLQNLVDKPEAAPTSTTLGSAPSPATHAPSSIVSVPPVPKQAAVAAQRQISIGAITIQGGTVAFSDSHLPQQFSSTFYNLGGRISGMSSDASRFADVDLRGNLENHSPLQITGKINPLREDLFVDLIIAFKDIELSPVTPYSGAYLGYAVEKGKLYLDLKYHIENKELRSENRIFIDQFTFGNRVESKQATNLPVRLGLALLKDRKGEIHLDVPVTGRTDDPQFSIWRLVFQVLKNLLVKAATSPFSLLSSMFGGGEDLSTIQFSPGTSALSAQDEQKLSALAKALADRPALKIELKGYVDREKDAEGYRFELLNHKLANEKSLSRARERQKDGVESGETVKVQPDEYSKYLKAVYKKEKFPKPRNMLGLVKDLPDNEMKKLIIANTVVTDSDLQSLAQERSAAVMNYLIEKGSLSAGRIFLKKDDINRAPEKSTQTRSRVELNAVAP
ncbi:MAG: DUF748 domain-containing protein [Desulfuromonadales bacterium]|nr:DUF748 domain-containing protein [Desulfuromonadales bacterium]